MNLEELPELATLGVALVSSIVAFISGIVSYRQSSKLGKQLQVAKERETYSICPHCGKKVYLSEMSFRLPSGAVDNNLDGKADE